jgi:hypothetical protein
MCSGVTQLIVLVSGVAPPPTVLCDTKPYFLSAPSAHPQRQHRLYFFGAGEKVEFVMVVALETPEKTFSMAHIELQLSDDESGGWR